MKVRRKDEYEAYKVSDLTYPPRGKVGTLPVVVKKLIKEGKLVIKDNELVSIWNDEIFPVPNDYYIVIDADTNRKFVSPERFKELYEVIG